MKWGKVILTFLTNISLLLGFSVLGILAMWGFGHLFQVVHSEGLFSSWKALDSSRSFERIVDATSQELWAQSSTGQLYYWTSNCYREAECNVWIKTQDVPANLHGGPEMEITREEACRGFAFLGSPRGDVVECVSADYRGPEIGNQVFYALVENGNIWSWSHSTSFLGLYIFLVSTPMGLIFGIIAFSVYFEKRKKQLRS